MTPATMRANLLLWAGALALAVLLSFLGALAKQLPGDAAINWRLVALDVIQTVVSLAPVVAAGLGLPRLGREGLASLVSEVGANKATDVLAVEAIKQQTGIDPNQPVGPFAGRLTPEQLNQVVTALEARMRATPAARPPAEGRG